MGSDAGLPVAFAAPSRTVRGRRSGVKTRASLHSFAILRDRSSICTSPMLYLMMRGVIRCRTALDTTWPKYNVPSRTSPRHVYGVSAASFPPCMIIALILGFSQVQPLASARSACVRRPVFPSLLPSRSYVARIRFRFSPVLHRGSQHSALREFGSSHNHRTLMVMHARTDNLVFGYVLAFTFFHSVEHLESGAQTRTRTQAGNRRAKADCGIGHNYPGSPSRPVYASSSGKKPLRLTRSVT